MGAQDFLLIPKMDKYAKKHVENKEVVHHVKKIVIKLEKKEKNFNKEQGDNWKKLEGIKSSDTCDYQLILAEIKNTRMELLEDQKGARKEIVNLLTEEEWNTIYKSASKDFENYKKGVKKKFKKLDKRYTKLEESIRKEIGKDSRQEDLLSITARFKEELYNGIKGQYELYFNNPELWQYEANAQTINETVSRANDFRMAYLVAFVEFRIQIVELTTDDERQKIIRRLNKLF